MSRRVHSSADSNSFIIGESIHTAAARFDFASQSSEFFLILFRPGLNLLQQFPGSRAHAANMAYLCNFRHVQGITATLPQPRHSTFAGIGCGAAEFATRAAFAMSASAAIFFWPSEPGCTTPQDMIKVAASSALMSTSMILLLGT